VIGLFCELFYTQIKCYLQRLLFLDLRSEFGLIATSDVDDVCWQNATNREFIRVNIGFSCFEAKSTGGTP